MFLPRILRPLPTASRLTSSATRRLAQAPFSVVRGPQDSYVAEWLAAAIRDWSRWQDCVWLRARRAQPAVLAGALTTACRYQWAGHGELEPDRGLASNAELDATIRRSPPGAVIVLELEGRVTSGLARLADWIRPVATDRNLSLVAVVENRPPAAVLRRADCVVLATELRDPAVVNDVHVLPSSCHDRLLGLVPRRTAVLHDVLDAARTWPAEAVVDAVEASRRGRSIMGRLTANLVALCSPAQQAALEVCVATGYWHPQLATDGPAVSELRPWVVPLEGQWGWLRPIWARSLERQLTDRTGRRRPPNVGHPDAGRPVPQVPDTERPAPRPAIVQARLLGSFQLRVNGLAVARWPGQRGLSVLRFLLSRREHGCSRDELLAEFWPEVDPATARNRLQVAVSGLRRALEEVTSLQVIQYAHGGYRINPELLVDVDAERFEEVLSTARSTEQAGDPDGALVAYQEAVGLYGGDFASDAPYEQWALLPRESLRIAYIDALDRMSRIQLRLGRVDDSIATGLRMLAVDPCREDAHRLLMRCYAHQGRVYQALRQYDFCRRALWATLELGPAPQTTQLYRMIREGPGARPSLID